MSGGQILVCPKCGSARDSRILSCQACRQIEERRTIYRSQGKMPFSDGRWMSDATDASPTPSGAETKPSAQSQKARDHIPSAEELRERGEDGDDSKTAEAAEAAEFERLCKNIDPCAGRVIAANTGKELPRLAPKDRGENHVPTEWMLSIEREPIVVDIRECEIWGDGRCNDLIKTSDGRFAFGQWSHPEHRYAVNRFNRYRLWEAAPREVIAWCNVGGYIYPADFMPNPQTLPKGKAVPSPPATTPPEESRPPEPAGPIVPGQPVGVGTTPQLIPSAEELASIADALRDLLTTFDKYKIFLVDRSFSTEAHIAGNPLEDCLRRLERVFNPLRRPPGEWGTSGVSGWPHDVMVGLLALKPHVHDIINRWDIPEICEDRPLGPPRGGDVRPHERRWHFRG